MTVNSFYGSQTESLGHGLAVCLKLKMIVNFGVEVVLRKLT